MTSERRQFWLWAGGGLLAGLLLRLWFVHHLARVAGDSLVYGGIAKTWLLHGIYGFIEQGPTPGSIMYRPTLIRLPGYPLFLSMCFRLFGMEHYGAAIYAQLAADLLTCWLAAATSSRLFGQRAFLPVLWLAALCPFTSSYVATPLTETLVLSTIAAVFYGFARWQQAGCAFDRWLYLIAAGLSYSILLRPDQGLLAAAVVPGMLWCALATHGTLNRAGAPVIVCCLCIGLPFIPWTARNWHTFHVFQPLAPRSASDPGETVFEGFNRWYRTWGIEFASTEDVYWNYDGARIEVIDIPTRAFAFGCRANAKLPREGQPLYAETAALLEEYNQQTAATSEVDDHFDRLARERIRANPVCYYAAFPVARLLNMILRPRTELMPIPVEWWLPDVPRRQRNFAAAYAALNLAYLLAAFAGLRRALTSAAASRATRILLYAMFLSVLLRSALLLTMDNSEARYTLEFFPVLFVFAGGLFIPRLPRPTRV